MAGRRVAGGGVLLERPQDVAEDAAYKRTQKAVEAHKAQQEALQARLAEMTEAEKVEWCCGVICEQSRVLEGIRAVLTPLAMHMDSVLQWRTEMQTWQAQTQGQLLFGGKPRN